MDVSIPNMVKMFMQKNHEQHLKDVMSNFNKYLEQRLHDEIKEHALPKIKGQITPGKLKWRGIFFCSCAETNEYWVMQRDKQIGKKIKFDFNFLNHEQLE